MSNPKYKKTTPQAQEAPAIPPSPPTTLDRVREVVSEITGVVDAKPEQTLCADLGMDSLDTVEFIVALEAEFGIHIPDVDFSDQTLAEVVRQVDELVAKN